MSQDVRANNENNKYAKESFFMFKLYFYYYLLGCWSMTSLLVTSPEGMAQ